MPTRSQACQVNDPQREAPDPTQVVARSVREVRDRRGWSAQQLADACKAAGAQSVLDRSALASIENGRRQRIGVDQLLALAFALDVSPLRLLLPLDDDELIQVVPSTTVTAAEARRWIRGTDQLPGLDHRQFAMEAPRLDPALSFEEGMRWLEERLARFTREQGLPDPAPAEGQDEAGADDA
jgi:transcriptional regulator with XRE-family HTH domain